MHFIKRAFAAVIYFVWSLRSVWYALCLIPAYFVVDQGLWFSGVVWAIFAFPVWVIAVVYVHYFAESPTQAKRRRGREVVDLTTARKNASKHRGSSDMGILWGGVRIPSEDAKNHFCVVGATGSGKSLTIKLLMKDQLSLIKPGTNTRAIVYDSEQDQVPILLGLGLRTEIIILNPFDKRAHAWDMAADISTIAQATELANILVPTPKNENNSYFTDAVRSLLTGVITVYMQKSPREWSFRQVLLALEDKQRLEMVLRSTPRTQQLVSQYLDPGLGITLNNVFSSIAARLNRYHPIAAAWDNIQKKDSKKSISVRDWINGNQILVLGNDETSRSTIDLINQVIFKFVSEQSLAVSESIGKQSRRTWFFFDEFSEAGNLPGLQSILKRGRKKGCCVVLGFQDINSVYKAYGEDEAKAIINECGQKALLRLESPPTAAWASDLIGEAEYQETSYSVSHSHQGSSHTFSENVVQRAEIIDSEFTSMPQANELNGLHGIYVTKNAGVFRHWYDFKALVNALPSNDSPDIAYSPCEPGDQEIVDWNSDDEALIDSTSGQVSTLALEATDANQPEQDSAIGLDEIKRIKLDN